METPERLAAIAWAYMAYFDHRSQARDAAVWIACWMVESDPRLQVTREQIILDGTAWRAAHSELHDTDAPPH